MNSPPPSAVPDSAVRVIVSRHGLAYGGKHPATLLLEAARLARAANHPVSVVWTRRKNSPGPTSGGGRDRNQSAISPDGTLAAWEFHNYHSGASASNSLRSSQPANRIHLSSADLRSGSYRGLAATANHFARESHIDDLAHAAGLDPSNFV